jgi:hypothetical protein
VIGVPTPARTGNSETSAARRGTSWQPEAVSFDVFLELFGSQQPEAARQAVAAVLRDLEATGQMSSATMSWPSRTCR